MKKSLLVMSILSLPCFALAAPSVHCVDASVYQPINQVLLGNSYAKYLRRHYIKNHHVWVGAFGQASMSYATGYALVPASSAITPIPEFVQYGRNFTMSLNQLDMYFGFQHNTMNFIAGYQFNDLASYNYNFFTPAYSLEQNFDLLEAYLTFAINPSVGVKAGYFIPSFGSYNPTTPLMLMANALNELVIGDSDSYATPGVQIAFTHGMFYGSLSGVQQGASTENSNEKNVAKIDTFIVNAGINTHVKGGLLGLGASYINKGEQDDFLDPDSTWRPTWTANAFYTNSKLNVKATVFNARVKPASVWVTSVKADYKVMPKIGVGVYGDYYNDPDETEILQALEPVHWTAGLHGQYRWTRQITLDAYLQYSRFDQFYTDALGVTKNIAAVGAVSIKL